MSAVAIKFNSKLKTAPHYWQPLICDQCRVLAMDCWLSVKNTHVHTDSHMNISDLMFIHVHKQLHQYWLQTTLVPKVPKASTTDQPTDQLIHLVCFWHCTVPYNLIMAWWASLLTSASQWIVRAVLPLLLGLTIDNECQLSRTNCTAPSTLPLRPRSSATTSIKQQLVKLFSPLL
jgi:hypothetical protein